MKGTLKVLGCAFLAILISGCTARTYTQVKQRVDQEPIGNAGYISGTPVPQDRSGVRKTRKTYVLDIEMKDKKLKEPAAPAKAAPQPSVEVSEESPRERYSEPAVYEAPVAPVVSEEASSNPSEYTVEKGDTLQKISKKFYDTYRLWNKIYEANKDAIKDPNRIKPGTVITIPAQ